MPLPRDVASWPRQERLRTCRILRRLRLAIVGYVESAEPPSVSGVLPIGPITEAALWRQSRAESSSPLASSWTGRERCRAENRNLQPQHPYICLAHTLPFRRTHDTIGAIPVFSGSMGFDLTRFAEARPRLYHLTARANLDGILRTGRLEAARVLMERAGDMSMLRQRRREHYRLRVDGREVVLRDQKPLHRGNIAFEGGFGFEDVVEALNRRVFFWPGDEEGPIDYGRRHFGRYGGEDCVVLVVPTAALLEANPDVQAEFCRFNSGSPRCTGGRGAPRGPRTFLPAHECPFSPGAVKEVTFREFVRLPAAGHVEVASHLRWAEVRVQT